MQYSSIIVLFTAALATALPATEKRQEGVTYYQGSCDAGSQLCYLSNGNPAVSCDPGSLCPYNGHVCTFASSNAPGDNPFATGKANCAQ